MLRRGLCLLLTAALCLTTGCVADRAAMQAEAEQALLAQQEETLRQEEAERRARQEERRRQAGEVLHAEMEEISALPSKDALYAKVLGTFLAPITSLAVVLNQIAEQKNGGPVADAEAPAAE